MIQVKELKPLGDTCFPPKFTKIYLLLFNICISTKSNIDLFYLDVLFQIFEVDHCLRYCCFLFLDLFLIWSYPFLLSCPPLAPEVSLIVWQLGDWVWFLQSYSTLCWGCTEHPAGNQSSTAVSLFLHFLKKKKKEADTPSYSVFSVDHLSCYVTGNTEAIRAGLLFPTTKSYLP